MRNSDKRLKDDFSFDYEQCFTLKSWIKYKSLMFYNITRILVLLLIYSLWTASRNEFPEARTTVSPSFPNDK